MPSVLAIIIPAYKTRHFAETLASLAAQNAPRGTFHVYVADDGSPEDIASIATSFADKLDLIYHRFSENLGRTSLIKHWDRAIALSKEPWVWLFSDDDEADPDTVGGILDVIAENKQPPPLIRIPLQTIDGAGRPLKNPVEYPLHQSHAEFIHAHISRPDLTCVIQNYVFTRTTYQAAGGFADLPGGMFSDLATWPRFAREGGLRSTPRGCVRYREHDGSISGGAKISREKRRALIAAAGPYFQKMNEEFSLLPVTERPAYPGLSFVAHMIKYYPGRFNFSEMRALEKQARQCWPRLAWKARLELWAAMLRPWIRHARQSAS